MTEPKLREWEERLFSERPRTKTGWHEEAERQLAEAREDIGLGHENSEVVVKKLNTLPIIIGEIRAFEPEPSAATRLLILQYRKLVRDAGAPGVSFDVVTQVYGLIRAVEKEAREQRNPLEIEAAVGIRANYARLYDPEEARKCLEENFRSAQILDRRMERGKFRLFPDHDRAKEQKAAKGLYFFTALRLVGLIAGHFGDPEGAKDYLVLARTLAAEIDTPPTLIELWLEEGSFQAACELNASPCSLRLPKEDAENFFTQVRQELSTLQRPSLIKWQMFFRTRRDLLAAYHETDEEKACLEESIPYLRLHPDRHSLLRLQEEGKPYGLSINLQDNDRPCFTNFSLPYPLLEEAFKGFV